MPFLPQGMKIQARAWVYHARAWDRHARAWQTHARAWIVQARAWVSHARAWISHARARDPLGPGHLAPQGRVWGAKSTHFTKNHPFR